MIYLIKITYKNTSLLKIGYTNNLEIRLREYRTHNPLVELISTREGDKELEDFLHKYFAKYSYPVQSEWFYFDKYIIDNFLRANLENYIPKGTLINNLFGKQDIKGLENKYIEKYGNKDFQLRKDYLHRFWDNLNDLLSEYSLDGCPDRIPVNSIITIKDLPFELGSVSLSLPQTIGSVSDSNSQKSTIEIELYCKTASNNRITQKLIDNKLEESNKIIRSVHEVQAGENRDALMRALVQSFWSDRYKSSYATIDYLPNGEMEVVINNLVLISEQRAFDIMKTESANQLAVFNTID